MIFLCDQMEKEKQEVQGQDNGATEVKNADHKIYLLTVIGHIEGHTVMPPQSKTTKYEHVIPQLVDIEEDKNIEGLFIVLNTVGGDVEAGLAIAEMIATKTLLILHSSTNKHLLYIAKTFY